MTRDEIALKIVQMAADESAEVLSEKVDPFSREIMSRGIMKRTDFYRVYFF
jgi:hypothetical protein